MKAASMSSTQCEWRQLPSVCKQRPDCQRARRWGVSGVGGGSNHCNRYHPTSNHCNRYHPTSNHCNRYHPTSILRLPWPCPIFQVFSEPVLLPTLDSRVPVLPGVEAFHIGHKCERGGLRVGIPSWRHKRSGDRGGRSGVTRGDIRCKRCWGR